MNSDELQLQKALIQINQGCYDHLMCWCIIYAELERIRARLGASGFETFREAFFLRACATCGVTPPSPGQTIPTTVVIPPAPPRPRPQPPTPPQPPPPVTARCTPMTAEQLSALSELDIREGGL
jgi:hypothetical protein